MAKTTCALVVDRHWETADSLAELIRVLGHRACVAYNAESARGLVDVNKPNVAFIDISMLAPSGNEFGRELKALAQPGRMLLVGISVFNNYEEKEYAWDAGCDLHMTKPLLFQYIRHILHSPDAFAFRLGDQTFWTQQPYSTAPTYDPA